MGGETENKLFVACLSVIVVILGTVAAAATVAIVISIWRAGFINFIVWCSVFVFIAWASRLVYHLALKNQWMDRL